MQVIEVSLCRLLFFEEEQMRNENMIVSRPLLRSWWERLIV